MCAPAHTYPVQSFPPANVYGQAPSGRSSGMVPIEGGYAMQQFGAVGSANVGHHYNASMPVGTGHMMPRGPDYHVLSNASIPQQNNQNSGN